MSYADMRQGHFKKDRGPAGQWHAGTVLMARAKLWKQGSKLTPTRSQIYDARSKHVTYGKDWQRFKQQESSTHRQTQHFTRRGWQADACKHILHLLFRVQKHLIRIYCTSAWEVRFPILDLKLIAFIIKQASSVDHPCDWHHSFGQQGQYDCAEIHC